MRADQLMQKGTVLQYECYVRRVELWRRVHRAGHLDDDEISMTVSDEPFQGNAKSESAMMLTDRASQLRSRVNDEM